MAADFALLDPVYTGLHSCPGPRVRLQDMAQSRPQERSKVAGAEPALVKEVFGHLDYSKP